jgi:hypothetical protein
MRRTWALVVLGAMVVGLGASEAAGQQRRAWTPPGEPAVSQETIDDAVGSGVKFLLSKQEAYREGPADGGPADGGAADGGPADHIKGEAGSEWPYEGVYRVNREIPIGYRVGGTSIAGLALMEAPGFAEDAERVASVRRAVAFVIASKDHPRMSPDYDGGYDTRGWGYTYAVLFLLEVKSRKVSEDQDAVEGAVRQYLSAIEKTAIPEVGGWNYARPAGNKPSPPSPFMTGPTLEALFEARSAGYAVSGEVVEKALKTLEVGRGPSGAVMYSGSAEGRARVDQTPGAVGRMLATEAVLFRAGRSSVVQVRGALDAFLVHWPWLEQRRAKNGTHEGPYAIAPYYFFYAHVAAARAVELLPEAERAEYRRRINQLLFSVRQEDGTWNDRVFPRSASYGTSMAMLALLQPKARPPAAWAPEAK